MTIGLAPGIDTPSSFFLMVVPGSDLGPDRCRKRTLLFADCAVNIDPSSEQLADIAIASAASAQGLLEETPRVAMLSFSTRGSAKHPRVDKVTRALEIARERAPGLAIDGELQVDSALIERVATSKVQGDSEVAGACQRTGFPGSRCRQHRLQAHPVPGRGAGDRPGPPGLRQTGQRPVARRDRRRHHCNDRNRDRADLTRLAGQTYRSGIALNLLSGIYGIRGFDLAKPPSPQRKTSTYVNHPISDFSFPLRALRLRERTLCDAVEARLRVSR